MRRLVLVACLAACGRVGFDATSDGRAGDAAPPTRGPWAQVVSNVHGTCAIQDSGEAWCWGLDLNNQLGLGPAQILHAPAQLAGAWRTIALGRSAGCGIQLDGSLWCWGEDNYGQIPDGITDQRSGTPVHIGTDVDWVDVSVGARHGCARKQDSTLWCWGDNSLKQYDASIPSSSVPRLTANNVRSASAANQHTHVVSVDGSLLVSGYIGSGDGFTGTYVQTYPGLTQVGVANDWSEVTGGLTRTCATKLDGTLWCSGNGDYGGNGDGMFSSSAAPVQVSTGTNWSKISVGIDHSCALRTDGTAWCWGATTRGQIGAQTADLNMPFALGEARSIAAGDYHTCMVTLGGVLRCSGSNVYGQITQPPGSALVPTPAGGTWTTIDAHGDSVCAIDAATNLACWGKNDTNQLGYNNQRWTQVPGFLGGTGWTAVAVGGSFSFGIRSGGLYWWGLNTGGTGAAPTPTQFLAGITDFTTVGVGREHGCALRGNGDLYCFGLNTSGQLGTGDLITRNTPTMIGSGFAKIAAGATHTCAVGTNIVCWGRGLSGQLGNNATADVSTPTAVTCAGCGGKTVRKFALGDDFSCANMTDGSLYCWGSNSDGQFGNGATTASLVGTPGGGSWATVAAGDLHMCGVTTTGELWCWGHGDEAQIGDGFANSVTSAPLRIGTATDWASVALGNHLSCALKTDGRRYCWGSNIGGIYGDGTSWIEDFITITPEQ